MRSIGMISGTSFDAIEAVAAELELDGTTLVADLRGHVSAALPRRRCTRRSRRCCLLPRPSSRPSAVSTRRSDSASPRSPRSCSTTRFAGEADVVCSHGQTVFHWVEGDRALGTLQLGQPAFIAERTGATVVGDVRGARHRRRRARRARSPACSTCCCSARTRSAVRGSLNLGGISNVTVVGPGREPLAYDIGPANALIDAVVSDATRWPRELRPRTGARRARARSTRSCSRVFLDEPYYALAPPKSTGKELFHLDYVRERVGDREIATDDLLATLTALSAEIVAGELRRLEVTEVVAAGGGTRNPTLMGELARRAARRADRDDSTSSGSRGGQGGAPLRADRLPHRARAPGPSVVHGVDATVLGSRTALASLGAIVPGRGRRLRLDRRRTAADAARRPHARCAA